MKNTYLLSLIIIIWSGSIRAQEYFKPDTARLEKSVASLSLALPGGTYERALSDKSSLFFQLTLGFAYQYRSTGFSSSEAYAFHPVLIAQYRSFYNLEKRRLFGRKTAYNSGGYLGFMTQYTFGAIGGKNTQNINVKNNITLGPVWGFQRNGFFSFGFSIGLGVTIDADQSSNIGPIGHLNFGFNLSKRKDK